MSAAITCKDPLEFVPSISFTDVSSSSQESVGNAVIANLTFKTVVLSGGINTLEANQSVPAFKAWWTMTTDTPAICTVTGNRAARVSPGVGQVRFTGPDGFAKVERVTFTDTSTTKYVWTGFSGISLASRLSDPILALVVPGKQKNYYSPNYQTGTTSVSRNSNCWAASLNLTGSPVATSLGGAANSGALITPRHWVGVAHWGSGDSNMGPGSELKFVGSDGVVHTRTVLRRKYEASKDRVTCLLNSDLPVTVTPFKLAGSGMFDVPNRRVFGMGWQITQEKSVNPISFNFVSLWRDVGLYNTVSPPTGLSWENFFLEKTDAAHRLFGFDSLIQMGRDGDSGGAIGGYYNGETFLVSLFSSQSAGSLFSYAQAAELNANIAELDALQGISTGYTVSVLNIT